MGSRASLGRAAAQPRRGWSLALEGWEPAAEWHSPVHRQWGQECFSGQLCLAKPCLQCCFHFSKQEAVWICTPQPFPCPLTRSLTPPSWKHYHLSCSQAGLLAPMAGVLGRLNSQGSSPLPEGLEWVRGEARERLAH